MELTATDFEGLYVFEPTVYKDNRGHFLETYNRKLLDDLGIKTEFVQDNESKSVRGVLRGLHYQIRPKAQTKLVRVIKGEVLDVVVDIRSNQPTYGKHFSIILSEENKKQLYIPKGFAHGFLTLSDEAVFCYKCDEFYSKPHEAGIRWNDSHINIDWGFGENEILISEKDKIQPTFDSHTAY